MEYGIHALAGLAGVSARTLRYYDQIGLLRPSGTTEAGYRLYGERSGSSARISCGFCGAGATPPRSAATILQRLSAA